MYDRRARTAAPHLLSQYIANFTVRPGSFRPRICPRVGPDARVRRPRRAYCGLVKPSRAGPRRPYLPGSPFNVPVVENPVETFTVGDLVTHDKYGLGRVIRADDETAILVDFGTARLRILLPCAKLIKL